MTVAGLKTGFTAMKTMNKDIDEEQMEQQPTRVVKLRFTRKQYQEFSNACQIFEVISQDPGFIDFVKSALSPDIKVSTISKQLVQPILGAPMKIPIKLPRKTGGNLGGPPKGSYFTDPTEVTDKCQQLYRKVGDEAKLRLDIREGTTCVSDVRVMMTLYIKEEGLKNDHGTVLDDFIRALTPKSLHENSELIRRIDGHYVIPKNDRKVMTGIIREIAFSA